jgi:hypothetical protein
MIEMAKDTTRNTPAQDYSGLPPHERRALVHRDRYHGRVTEIPPWTVEARLKQLDRGGYRVRALCGFVFSNGQACPALLGEATRPDGINTDAASYGRHLLEFETYGRREGGGRSEEWTLTAPKEFPGFQRVEDGSFRVIRSRKERTLDGTPVRRWTGRHEAPNVLYSAYMPLAEPGRPGGTLDTSGRNRLLSGTAGWWAGLPAVVACPLCKRANLVEEPTAD